MLNIYKNTAFLAARRAGALMLKNIPARKKLTFKGIKNIVTNVDKACERLIFRTILEKFPSHSILSEESIPENNNPDSRFKWIIDPLDGTSNYSHNLPFFGVSIALEIEGEVKLGVVYLPVFREFFYAEKGKGAFLNGKKIHVSRNRDIQISVLATGFPYAVNLNPFPHFNLFQGFCLNSLAVRRAGSAAMDISYTACGRFDGFWEFDLHPWDVAAAALILSEAGGKLSDYSGREFSVYDDEIVASNRLIHNQMLKIVSKYFYGKKSAKKT